MINTNLNATIRINSVDLRTKNLFDDFTPIEKNEMIASLVYLGSDFQNFILAFYGGFMDKNTLRFVQNQSEESLINLLSSALNLIITCIDQPIPLADYIDVLIQTHPQFPKLVKNTDLFAKSFMKALIACFKENYNERLGVLWFKAVSTFAVSVNQLVRNRN